MDYKINYFLRSKEGPSKEVGIKFKEFSINNVIWIELFIIDGYGDPISIPEIGWYHDVESPSKRLSKAEFNEFQSKLIQFIHPKFKGKHILFPSFEF
jgi:hypothetical protein